MRPYTANASLTGTPPARNSWNECARPARSSGKLAIRNDTPRSVATNLETWTPYGTGQREAWSRALFGVISTLGRIVETELRAKLNIPELLLTWDELRASDLSGRARAFQSMVGAATELDHESPSDSNGDNTYELPDHCTGLPSQPFSASQLGSEKAWGAEDDDKRVEVLRHTFGELRKRGIGFTVHTLQHSLVPDPHYRENGPVRRAGSQALCES